LSTAIDAKGNYGAEPIGEATMWAVSLFERYPVRPRPRSRILFVFRSPTP
jgi:hypothetical protein